ncbi:hypothetical protein N7457_007239 [Penicillium paradoxum]|uniref:uncharacterized protein n=1 Tax=Penicillium paradoxum TaxID=176176 RepID=UPI00254784A3|nr:uncharacterized protein N7457_007239 [Penicillium paradoxum]KAJ5779519.1 hypothetical protein N7457_007239 [Penicillium paradoxum]
MDLPIGCSIENLIATLESLRKYPEDKVSPKLQIEALLSSIHFHVTKEPKDGPSPLNIQSEPRGSYLGVCNSRTRARSHGYPESCFWYAMEDSAVIFMAIYRPPAFLRSEALALEARTILYECFEKRKRLKKATRNTYVIATDSVLFRFSRLACDRSASKLREEHGALIYNAEWAGRDYKDLIVMIVSIFKEALLPPDEQSIDPDQRKPTLVPSLTDEEIRKQKQRLLDLTVRVGVKVYMDVIKQLPTPMDPTQERNTINQIQWVVKVTLLNYVAGMDKGEHMNYHDDLSKVVWQMFDAKMKETLKNFEFKDYSGDREVLKKAIRKAAMEEIAPMLGEFFELVRNFGLASVFK